MIGRDAVRQRKARWIRVLGALTFAFVLAGSAAPALALPIGHAVSTGWLTEDGSLGPEAIEAAGRISTDTQMAELKRRIDTGTLKPETAVVAKAADLDASLGLTGLARKKLSRVDVLTFIMTGGRTGAPGESEEGLPPPPDVVILNGDLYTLDRESDFAEYVRDLTIARKRAVEVFAKMPSGRREAPVVLSVAGNHERHRPWEGTKGWMGTHAPLIQEKLISGLSRLSRDRNEKQSLYTKYIAPSKTAPYPHSEEGDYQFELGDTAYLMMDSSSEGTDVGALSPKQNKWLADQLQNLPAHLKNISFNMHHAPDAALQGIIGETETSTKRPWSHGIRNGQGELLRVLTSAMNSRVKRGEALPNVTMNTGHFHGYAKTIMNLELDNGTKHPVEVRVGPVAASPTFAEGPNAVALHGYQLTIGGKDHVVFLNHGSGATVPVVMTEEEADTQLFARGPVESVEAEGQHQERVGFVPKDRVMRIERYPVWAQRGWNGVLRAAGKAHPLLTRDSGGIRVTRPASTGRVNRLATAR